MTLPFWKRERWGVWLLLLAAFGLRLWSLAATFDQPQIGDAQWYEEVGWSLSQGGDDLRGRDFLRPPLYPLFISLVYVPFGRSQTAVFVVQALLGTLVCWLVYLIGKRAGGSPVGLLSLALCALSFSLIKVSALFLTECLFTFFLVSSTYLLLRLSQEGGGGRAVLLGVVLGLAALTRASIAVFPLCIAGGLLLWQPRRWSRRVACSMIVLSVFFLTLLPWTVRNFHRYGRWIPIATQGGIGFYSSYRPPEGKFFGFSAQDATTRYADSHFDSEIDKSRFLFREGWRFIRENPGQLPRLELLKVAFLWLPFDWEILGDGVFNASYGFLVPFILWGMGMLLKRMRDLWVLYLPILYLQVMALLFYGSPRFRLPIEPFLAVFASFGLMRFFSLFSRKWLPSCCLGAWLGAQWFLYSNSEMFRFQARSLASRLGLW